MSPARYSCISTASKTKAKALLDDTTMSTRAVSSCIREAKTYLAQLYINRNQQSENISELYISSNQKLKRKHFWTTHLLFCFLIFVFLRYNGGFWHLHIMSSTNTVVIQYGNIITAFVNKSLLLRPDNLSLIAALSLPCCSAALGTTDTTQQ